MLSCCQKVKAGLKFPVKSEALWNDTEEIQSALHQGVNERTQTQRWFQYAAFRPCCQSQIKPEVAYDPQVAANYDHGKQCYRRKGQPECIVLAHLHIPARAISM